MIVDFSVEDNRRIPVVTQNRLIPALQIDDLQAHRAQCRFAAFEHTLLVRPAMRNRFRDALRNSLAGALTSTCKPRDSTHLRQNPRSRTRTGSKSSDLCGIYHNPPCSRNHPPPKRKPLYSYSPPPQMSSL